MVLYSNYTIYLLIDIFYLEIDLNPYFNFKSQKPIINDIFIDPSGRHCLISVGFEDSVVKSNSNFNIDTNNIVPYENFHYYRKLSILTKMRGHIVTSVGWLPMEQPVANISELTWPDQNYSSHCSNFLVGTNDGRIFETHLQSDDRFLSSKELSFWKFVCDLSIVNPTSNLDSASALPIEHSSAKILTSIKESICAINCFRLKNLGEFCILVATRKYFYQYLGLVNRQSLVDGSPYLFQVIQNSTYKTYKEMPGYIPRTKLDLFYSIDNQYPKSFGWLTSMCCSFKFYDLISIKFRTRNILWKCTS